MKNPQTTPLNEGLFLCKIKRLVKAESVDLNELICFEQANLT